MLALIKMSWIAVHGGIFGSEYSWFANNVQYYFFPGILKVPSNGLVNLNTSDSEIMINEQSDWSIV